MIKRNCFILFIIIFFTVTILTSSISMAGDPIEDPNFYKPGSVTQQDTNLITNRANSIIGVVITVGVVISAITLTILGIKYMLGSVEEKAEYKKSMIPYIIGIVLLIASSTIVGIIAQLMQGTSLAN